MNNNENKNEKLRKEAEERLKTFSTLKKDHSEEDVNTLLYELSVYQIELEMQNQELRESQQRLEESRDQYTDLFEFAPLGYFILDKNGVILNCNLTGCGMLGIERSKLIGKPFAFLVSNSFSELSTFRSYLKKIFNDENPKPCEVLLQRKNERIFSARLDALLIKDESDSPNHCRIAITDIRGEKEMDRLHVLVDATLQGQELERERIAAELHDSIKPLLSIANLNVQSLLDTPEKDHQFSNEKLESTISILENAIDGIKEISNNLSPAVLKSFGLKKALEQLCNRVRTTGQLKVEFHTHGVNQNLDDKIELAFYRIAQELFNNIINHAEATETELQLIRHQKSLVLMISDNGVGFDAPVQKLKTNGFGFKNITSRVESLNGTINFDSSQGKGTTITIEIPLM